MKLTLYLLAGSALILPAIVYLVIQSGQLTFDLLALMETARFTPDQQRLDSGHLHRRGLVWLGRLLNRRGQEVLAAALTTQGRDIVA